MVGSLAFLMDIFLMVFGERGIQRERRRKKALGSLREYESSRKFVQKVNAIYDAMKAEVVERAVGCCGQLQWYWDEQRKITFNRVQLVHNCKSPPLTHVP